MKLTRMIRPFSRMKFLTMAQWWIPFICLATMSLSLGLGSRDSMRAAVVYAAPPSARGFAWQVLTLREDRGVRIPDRVPALRVVAHLHQEQIFWTGSSNHDGVAEVHLAHRSMDFGTDVLLEIYDDETDELLAHGKVQWRTHPWGRSPSQAAFVEPSAREGDIKLDVAIVGQRLTPLFPGELWVRATDSSSGKPLEDITLHAKPEPGLAVQPLHAISCSRGWASFKATAHAHLAGVLLQAKNRQGQAGQWWGSLPMALSSAYVSLPAHLEAETAHSLDLFAPLARRQMYFELNDAQGRVFAAALPLQPHPSGFAHAQFKIPALSPGFYWLVTSSEPRGAEVFVPSTVARPFYVTLNRSSPSSAASAHADSCAEGSSLAMSAGGTFSRWIALDGFAAKVERYSKVRTQCRRIALGSLWIGMIAEGFLFLYAIRQSSPSNSALHEDFSFNTKTFSRSLPRWINILTGLCLGLLGFGLLVVFILYLDV